MDERSRKLAVRAALRRWHPDRWTVFRKRVAAGGTANETVVMARVNAIAAALNRTLNG